MQRFEDMPIHSEQEMIQDMERHLQHMQNYSRWTIGLTGDPDKRAAELEEPAFWCQWRAETPAIAQRVMQFFVNKGMKPQTPAPQNATFVYIY